MGLSLKSCIKQSSVCSAINETLFVFFSCSNNEFGGSLELIKFENHERSHLQLLRSMRENQVLHLSHVRCMQYWV